MRRMSVEPANIGRFALRKALEGRPQSTRAAKEASSGNYSAAFSASTAASCATNATISCNGRWMVLHSGSGYEYFYSLIGSKTVVNSGVFDSVSEGSGWSFRIITVTTLNWIQLSEFDPGAIYQFSCKDSNFPSTCLPLDSTFHSFYTPKPLPYELVNDGRLLNVDPPTLAVSPVAEPSMLGLFATGAFGLEALRWRQSPVKKVWLKRRDRPAVRFALCHLAVQSVLDKVSWHAIPTSH